MFTPINNIPRHARQQEFEELFDLGDKEVLFKTFQASLQKEGELFASSGKLWVSVNHICFSAPHFTLCLNFGDVQEFKLSGLRSITVVLCDGTTKEISGLWKKDECYKLLSSIWFNNVKPDSSRTSSSRTHSPLPSVAQHHHEVPKHEVGKTLDQLDEVADLLLITPSSEKLRSPKKEHEDVSCDEYGFPFESETCKEMYMSFVESYSREQEKMKRKWVSFIQKRPVEQELLQPSNKDEVKNLLLRGVPPSLRPSIYFQISGARKKRNLADSDYYAKLSQEAVRISSLTEWGRAIEKDILRTYPYHPDFSEDEGTLLEPLRRILFAYGLRNKTVGYCQGMNFVCGALLLLFQDIRNEAEKEEKTFWVLCAIVEDLLPSYYSGDMIGSMVDQSVLAFYVERVMPKLYEKFSSLQYPISLVLIKWMNCLFWLNTPSETAARIMDVVVLLGCDALVEFSLGFLAAFQSKLCQCQDLHEISRLLDKSMLEFFPTPGNVDKMQSYIGQLNLMELTSMRHIGFEQAEIRLRAYSTGKAIDRLRNSVSFNENDLHKIQDHWDHLCALSNHKDGLDKESFFGLVISCIAPLWSEEPELLEWLFNCTSKSGTVVNVTEWTHLIENLSTKKGKFKVIYAMSGGGGDPVRVAKLLRLLCSVLDKDEERKNVNNNDNNDKDDIGEKKKKMESLFEEIEKRGENFNPDTFVRAVKNDFPQINK